jgi:predicted ATPase
MLQTVTIQNFRSLRDVTVTLRKVNLLIGPNNSGKSNFLKALAFLKEHYNQRIQPGLVDFERLFFKHEYDSVLLRHNLRLHFDNDEIKHIKFSFKWNQEPEHTDFYQLELFGFTDRNQLVYNEGAGFFNTDFSNITLDLFDLEKVKNTFASGYFLFENNSFFLSERIKKEKNKQGHESDLGVNTLVNYEAEGFSFSNWLFATGNFLREYGPYYIDQNNLIDLFNSIKIFRPDPSRITAENELFTHNHMNEDGSNLVAFLDNMRDGYDHIWQAIQKDLNKCIPDFVGINFDKVKIKGKESLGKRFGLRDKEGKTYWAEELSEGTIYFLALLAIVHQPDPPKLLLLEEPEKGIHPRRIAEVMDLIFKLAEEKDIQIILTSHSTQVVDAFQDIPESVFVFDMVDGETKIKNLQTDILEPDAKDAESKGFPAIDYTKRSLSEHWAIGLLGGVPH